jgi:hypothetical protein
VLAFLELDDPAPAGYPISAELPHLKARHSPAEVARLMGGDIRLLLERLVLLRAAGGTSHGRSQGETLELDR